MLRFGGREKNGVKRATLKERLDMYDMILANAYAKDAVIEPDVSLDNASISVGFSSVTSASQISKYYLIKSLPDYVNPQFIDRVRSQCVLPGVKVNFFIYTSPHVIRWDTSEMRNKMNIWEDYTSRQDGSEDAGAFKYRENRDTILAKRRIADSTMYLNRAELDYKRTTMKVSILVEFTGFRDDNSIRNLSEAIQIFKQMCRISEIKIMPIQNNTSDWMQSLGPFSLKNIKEVASRMPKKLMTDDVLSFMTGYKQGRVGDSGVPLGIDIKSRSPVLWNFKEDPDRAENWLVSAATGGGKSYFVKALITYLLARHMVGMVVDFEGDEYTNLADFLYDGNPDDVRIVSMGKGSNLYCDPMEIPPRTGEKDIDSDLKDSAKSFTLAIFRIIVRGTNDQLSQDEERVISMAIKRVYDRAGVTEDQDTWDKSKGLRVENVYREIKAMVTSEELLDEATNNSKHKAAVGIVDAATVYFEVGESKYGAFKNPIAIEELYKAQLVIFSFGLKGQAVSQIDPALLALKQLSVSNISIQLSNYSKYVKHCFNFKVWEEYQRWGEAQGSAEIICNAMTGGRKRGDINFLITNDLANLMNMDNKVTATLAQNIQGMAIGLVASTKVIHQFCVDKDLMELEPTLKLIAKHSGRKQVVKTGSGRAGGESDYCHAFALILPDGKKAVAKVMLPQKLAQSSLFKTGVQVEQSSAIKNT